MNISIYKYIYIYLYICIRCVYLCVRMYCIWSFSSYATESCCIPPLMEAFIFINIQTPTKQQFSSPGNRDSQISVEANLLSFGRLEPKRKINTKTKQKSL